MKASASRLASVLSSEGKRLRGRPGQRQRLRRLRRSNGLGERCQKAGRIEAATEVNHIIPLALGGEDVDENTENLCTPCHRTVTAEQFGHRLFGCDESGLPTDPRHPWRAGGR